MEHDSRPPIDYGHTLDSLFMSPSTCIDEQMQRPAQVMAGAEAPWSDTLASADLDLLNHFLGEMDTAAIAARSVDSDTGSDGEHAQHQECARCASNAHQCSRKRQRMSVDGKPTSRGKSQSQRQREEIAALKQQVEELAATLKGLQAKKRQRELAAEGAELAEERSSSSGCVEQPAVKSELQNVEDENKSLMDEMATGWDQLKDLQRLVVSARVQQLRVSEQHELADNLTGWLEAN